MDFNVEPGVKTRTKSYAQYSIITYKYIRPRILPKQFAMLRQFVNITIVT